MQTITLVTGNASKLTEWRRLFPAEFDLQSADIDLDEIQSLDLEVIIRDKARRAYEQLQAPIIVEDVSAGLDKLGGLPGPFIKYFEKAMGSDALFQLSGEASTPGKVICTVTYYDGKTMIVGRGEIQGSIVASRGKAGFGFDHCFVPSGQSKTFAEMTPAEKDAISHRSLAIKNLIPKLQAMV